MEKNVQMMIKRRVGEKAAELVQNGMIVGIGSGSTAVCFIESLIERCRQGLSIQAVSTSIHSAQLAKSGNIPIIDDQHFTQIDLCIDGADEVAADKTLIKGGGGNLVREKIVAASSREMVVIIDESKLVKRLGAFGLPLEILHFGWKATVKKINDLGFIGSVRLEKNGSAFISDNGNYIYDIKLDPATCHPHKDDAALRNIPGVVDTGFFFHIAQRFIVGYADGRVETYGNLHKII